MREAYIETADRLGVTDTTITDAVRAEYLKPALNTLLINGSPIRTTAHNGKLTGADFSFDYNWLMGGYYGAVRFWKPQDYDDYTNDNLKSFEYLVEQLGGVYSYEYDSMIPSLVNINVDWWLGGNDYGMGAILQENIPTMSAYSINDEGISVDHAFSKDMWGLEDGYDPSDFYILISPDSFAKILGVEAVADYDKGTLDLITPDGYFDHEPPKEESFEERFEVVNGIGGVIPVEINSTYTIYNANGTVLETDTTLDYTYAECTQINENIVMLHVTGAGSKDDITFFDTDSGNISKIYRWAKPVKYPYIVHSPAYSREIYLENIETRERVLLADDAYDSIDIIKSAKMVLTEDGATVYIVYLVPNALDFMEEKSVEINVELP